MIAAYVLVAAVATGVLSVIGGVIGVVYGLFCAVEYVTQRLWRWTLRRRVRRAARIYREHQASLAQAARRVSTPSDGFYR